MIELLDPAEIVVDPQLAEFYGIEFGDDHVLEMAELLESVCPGLGDWYLDLDPEGEFQRDLLASAKLFWERQKGLCKCPRAGKTKAGRVKPRPRRHSPSPNRKGPTLLQSCRQSRGLSQHQFVKIVGVTQPSIWRWEHGELRQPKSVRAYTRANLEAFFGKPLGELLKPSEQSGGETAISQAVGIQ